MADVHIYELNTDKHITGGELLLSSDTDHTTKPIRVDDLKAYINKDVLEKLEEISKQNMSQANKIPWYKKIFHIKK